MYSASRVDQASLLPAVSPLVFRTEIGWVIYSTFIALVFGLRVSSSFPWLWYLSSSQRSALCHPLPAHFLLTLFGLFPLPSSNHSTWLLAGTYISQGSGMASVQTCCMGRCAVLSGLCPNEVFPDLPACTLPCVLWQAAPWVGLILLGKMLYVGDL